jgi:hypothetical protein
MLVLEGELLYEINVLILVDEDQVLQDLTYVFADWLL